MEKDFTEKKFIDFNDVFADIVNVLLFQGERRVLETDLESGMARSGYRIEGKIEEQERDVKKFWKNGNIRIAMFGMENQTKEDSDFIFRSIGYDGAEYRDQFRTREAIRRKNRKLRKESPDDKNLELTALPDYYPVVTIALYFSDSHWKGGLSLKDHLNIPEGLEGYVSDYCVNLFEIAYLSDEQVNSFQSDFRYVAEYFVQNRKAKEGILPEYRYSLKEIRHIYEFIDLMNAVINSDKFSKLDEIITERGDATMMTIIDVYEAKGEAKGGVNKLMEQIRKKIEKQKDFEQIVEECESTPEEIRPLYDAILSEKRL